MVDGDNVSNVKEEKTKKDAGEEIVNPAHRE